MKMGSRGSEVKNLGKVIWPVSIRMVCLTPS